MTETSTLPRELHLYLEHLFDPFEGGPDRECLCTGLDAPTTNQHKELTR